MIANTLKLKLTQHPTTIVIVAAVMTLVFFSLVYFEIDSMGESERSAIQEIRELETTRGQIVFYGEILTSSTLMAAVTGNDAWSDRFLEHRVLLGDALNNLKELIRDDTEATALTEDSTFKLLGYENEAFELIQQNRADEARHMLFGAAYQEQKIRHEQSIAQLDSRVDAYIENNNQKIQQGRDRTQQFIIVTLLIILGGWVSVLFLIHSWQREIRQLAFYDPLTGLASRRYFMLQIDTAIKLADREGSGLTVLFMDLDGFKDVNDTMGHDTGDHLLKEIANRLSAVARQTDFVSRLGGDEFCILLENYLDDPDVVNAVERYIEAIEAPVDLSAKQFSPRTSIGIARYPQDGTDAQVLMKSADSAMYSAKKTGKHSYEYYSSELTVQAEQRLTLISDLRNAFRHDEFLLHYQPIVNLRSGRIEGVEALVRWQHPRRGLVPPTEFVCQLELMGLIDKLGEWVLERATIDALDWTFLGRPLRVAVNISPQHFLDSSFVHTAKEIISGTGISPDRVVLEITESTFQHNVSGYENFMELREHGIKLAIDDFGTGYSSLGSLNSLPIDILKIDRIFVQNLSNDPSDSVMLNAIMDMARGFDLKVVVEGVEEVEQAVALYSLGCDLAQGYHFHRPVSADEITALLTAGQVMKIPNPQLPRMAG